MEALADKIHKQGEHIPQHCYISYNHPYISSSGYWYCATKVSMVPPSVSLLLTYVGMVVWNHRYFSLDYVNVGKLRSLKYLWWNVANSILKSMLWNVLSLFAYFISQCLHPSTPSLNLIDSFRNLCKFLVSAPFLLLATAHALAVDASVIRARAPSNGAHGRKGLL